VKEFIAWDFAARDVQAHLSRITPPRRVPASAQMIVSRLLDSCDGPLLIGSLLLKTFGANARRKMTPFGHNHPIFEFPVWIRKRTGFPHGVFYMICDHVEGGRGVFHIGGPWVYFQTDNAD
jgi:hypothetical protein